MQHRKIGKRFVAAAIGGSLYWVSRSSPDVAEREPRRTRLPRTKAFPKPSLTSARRTRRSSRTS